MARLSSAFLLLAVVPCFWGACAPGLTASEDAAGAGPEDGAGGRVASSGGKSGSEGGSGGKSDGSGGKSDGSGGKSDGSGGKGGTSGTGAESGTGGRDTGTGGDAPTSTARKKRPSQVAVAHRLRGAPCHLRALGSL